jgi:hypothetical protein
MHRKKSLICKEIVEPFLLPEKRNAVVRFINHYILPQKMVTGMGSRRMGQ